MGPIWGWQDQGEPHVGPMNFVIWDALKFVPKGPTDKPALVQVVAWYQTGDKPLPESMLTQFIDANMQH